MAKEVISPRADSPRRQERGWRRLLTDLAAPPQGPRFCVVRFILIPLALLGLLTLFARQSDFDLEAQKWIYRIGGDSWEVGKSTFWRTLYEKGPLPAKILAFTAIGALALSWSISAFGRWRRVYLFIILSGVIGPGVITNLLLKEYWGRPRPRDLVEFGGRFDFEPVLTYDATSGGLSFPCGHATMGFFFLGGVFLFRRHRPGLADAFLFGALVLGGLMGLARMVQGGHFFSDVVWAGGVCWFTSLGLYYALRLDRSLVTEGIVSRRMPLFIKIALSLVAAALLLATLLATPYSDRATISMRNELATADSLVLRLGFVKGSAQLVAGEDFEIAYEGIGHGIPTSRISTYELINPSGDTHYVTYLQRVSGWFKELDLRTSAQIPWEKVKQLNLTVGKADLSIEISENKVRESPLAIRVNSGQGHITIDPGPNVIQWRGEVDDPRIKSSADILSKKKEMIRLHLDDDFHGEVTIVGKKTH